MEKNPFEKIVRSKRELDYETQRELADLLEPYLWLDPESNSVTFTKTGANLTTQQKVYLYAVGKKIISLLNHASAPCFSPNDVQNETGLPGGTIRPKLTQLVQQRRLIRKNSLYEVVPGFLVSDVEEVIKSAKE
jgi:hypothetical protein